MSDIGNIIDGVVQKDPGTGRYLVVDEDGIGYDIHSALESLDGQNVRVTLVTMQAIMNMELMLRGLNG